MEEKKTVWVLTYEVNDYDQHGEYLHSVFSEKPTAEKLALALGADCPGNSVGEALAYILHILNGGGRKHTENAWYHLKEVEAL